MQRQWARLARRGWCAGVVPLMAGQMPIVVISPQSSLRNLHTHTTTPDETRQGGGKLGNGSPSLSPAPLERELQD